MLHKITILLKTKIPAFAGMTIMILALIIPGTALSATLSKSSSNSTLSQGLTGWWKFDDMAKYIINKQENSTFFR